MRFTQMCYFLILGIVLDVTDSSADSWSERQGNRPPKTQGARAGFCQSRLNSPISSLLLDSDDSSKIAFSNPLGNFGTGLCWMHSRWQRSALYLAHFRPELRKPTLEEARRIIADIAHRRRVVEVPGYADLRSFTADFEQALVDELNYAGTDCFVNPLDCAQRLGDPSEMDPRALRERMDDIYYWMTTNPGDVLFVRIKRSQDNGNPFISHSLLILKADPILPPGCQDSRTPGCDLQAVVLHVIDSNSPNRVIQARYTVGETRMDAPDLGYQFIPVIHVQYLGDTSQMREKIRDYCSGRG